MPTTPTESSTDLRSALAHHQAGRFGEAEAAYKGVLERQPKLPVALHGMGVLYHQLGRHEEAIGLIRRAVEASPRSGPAVARAVEFRCNLAAVLGRLERHTEAAAELRAALAARPDYTDGWCNLGVALEKSGRYRESAEAYQRAIELNSAGPASTNVEARLRLVRAHHFLGNVLRRAGLVHEAETACRAALRLDPNYASGWAALATILAGQGRQAEVVEARRKLVELRPRSAAAHSALLATLHYLSSSTPQMLLEEAREWGRRHAAGHLVAPSLEKGPGTEQNQGQARMPVLPQAGMPVPPDGAPAVLLERRARMPVPPNQRLRVGFLSTNLCAHPEGRFLRPVLGALDRVQFETFCYSSTGRPDALTETLRGQCDTWRDIRPLNDARAAEAIRDDGIDVLVDLTGHFGANRMGTLARGPAPVQVCHFGYPGTSGIPKVGWRLTDRWSDPPGAGDPPDGVGPYAPPDQRPGNYTTERLFGLGELAWCYDPPAEARSVGPLPALSRGGQVTFVCVNNPLKVAPAAVAVWAEVLRGVPGSVLEVLADGRKRRPARRGTGPEAGTDREPDREPAAAYLSGLFERHGVSPERVRLVPRRPRAAYFDWIHAADVALDPFPYNGGVTTCDTLWMGLPVVALRGDAYWSRQGAALLGNLGLGELVADTPEGYARIAIELARDVDRLAELRRGLRDRMRASPITDAASFAGRLGEAYWRMWRQTAAAPAVAAGAEQSH